MDKFKSGDKVTVEGFGNGVFTVDYIWKGFVKLREFWFEFDPKIVKLVEKND